LPFIQANVDKLDHYKSDDNDSIIAVVDIPQQPPHALLVVNDTNNDNDVGSGKDANAIESKDNESIIDNNAESNDNKLSNLAAATDLDGNKPDESQECKDHSAEERASPRSTPITVC
jgi:hypothetical protein